MASRDLTGEPAALTHADRTQPVGGATTRMPARAVTGPGGASVRTRYVTGIGGERAATIDQDGSVAVMVANLHGDILSTVPIPATAAGSQAAAGIAGWWDYTEYGTPLDPTTTTTTSVGGVAGCGWLGAKQRATSAGSAGLTLMGARLYNPTTGRFTSPDPIPGGNDTTYTYPNDPINTTDIDGDCGLFGNPFRKCNGGGKQPLHRSFCGNAGCITYQVTPYGGVSWGVVMYNGGRGVFTKLRVYVNGKLFDRKDGYSKGIVHGYIPQQFLARIPQDRLEVSACR
jgi:RHS repeat-associated protein